MNTHYAVVTFSGDPCDEHPDEELRGQPPSMQFIACGPEQFCWDALASWTVEHPLRMWEEAEVLARDPEIVRQGVVAAQAHQDARTRAQNDEDPKGSRRSGSAPNPMEDHRIDHDEG